MMKLIKYLKPFIGSIIVIIALLFIQAISELSLPDYMSNIVNVGIQQGGIENSVPKIIRKSEKEKLSLFIEENDNKKIEDNYKLISKDNLSLSEYNDYLKKYPLLEQEDLYELNTNNKEVREYLLNVAKYWVKEIGIDGWRLDVCDEVSHDFWRDFRKAVKGVKRDAIIVGEIMHEANAFLKGDRLDSIMNYPFKNATIDFFGKHSISALEYLDILAANRILYMNSITKQMWNLVGSHDTKRIINECDNNVNKVRLAIAIQFTYVGVPYIYYGDEVGITGGDDPDNRKCMIWDEEKQNKEILNLYKLLIKIRKENKSLVHGSFEVIYCKDEVIGFIREYYDDKIMVIFNNSEEEQCIKYQCKKIGIDLITERNIDFSEDIKIEPLDFMIIKF